MGALCYLASTAWSCACPREESTTACPSPSAGVGAGEGEWFKRHVWRCQLWVYLCCHLTNNFCLWQCLVGREAGIVQAQSSLPRQFVVGQCTAMWTFILCKLECRMWPQIFLLGLTNPFLYPVSSLPSNMQQWPIAQEVYCSCSGIWKNTTSILLKSVRCNFSSYLWSVIRAFLFCKFCISLASFTWVSSCICNLRSNKEQFCLDLLSLLLLLFYLYSVYQMDHMFSFEEGYFFFSHNIFHCPPEDFFSPSFNISNEMQTSQYITTAVTRKCVISLLKCFFPNTTFSANTTFSTSFLG